MKTLKLSYIPVLALLVAMVMNSCGTTNFKGYYPDKNITGKGIGYDKTTDATVAAVETEVTTETTVDAALTTSVEEVVAVNDGTAPKKGEKLEKWAMNYIMKSELAAGVPAITGKTVETRKLTLGQRLNAKLMNKMIEKRYGSLDMMSTDDIFAIVSVSAGGASLLFFWLLGGFIFGIPAIVFGALALSRGTQWRWMAILGICLGAFALLLSALSFVLWRGFLLY